MESFDQLEYCVAGKFNLLQESRKKVGERTIDELQRPFKTLMEEFRKIRAAHAESSAPLASMKLDMLFGECLRVVEKKSFDQVGRKITDKVPADPIPD